MKTCYWITWEDHRRSRELAKSLDAKYVAFHQAGSRYIRYPILSLKTIFFLFNARADIVYCQNPSILLTTIVCFLKLILRYRVIVDRHSNFKFQLMSSRKWKWKLFHFLSRYTIRYADLTIVTNDFLKGYLEDQRGRGFVLPDKLPTLSSANIIPLKGAFNFVFISTFSDDEPIEQVISAMDRLDESCHLYITGRFSTYKNIDALLEKLPTNVTLTGFLSESDYQSLLISADILIIITDQEYTLTCGAYEAVTLEKPMILGDTNTIKNYFCKGAIYTKPLKEDIAAKMLETIQIADKMRIEVGELKNLLAQDWQRRYEDLQIYVRSL